MATADQQLAQLMQQMAAMQDRVQTLEGQNYQLEQRLAAQTAHTQPQPREERGGLFDKKLFEPSVLEDARDFKEWSEDFQDWIEMCDGDIPPLLQAATREKEQITALGPNAGVVAKSKPLYRMLKRFIKLKPAKQTVTLAPGKNPYEAWRLLFATFHPKNDSTAGAVVIRVCDWKFWKCKTLADVPLTISQWEKLQDDYKQEFHLLPLMTLQGGKF